jgi:Predicted ATPase
MAEDEQKVANTSSKKDAKPTRSESKSKALRRVPFADATAIGRKLTTNEVKYFLGLLAVHGLSKEHFCRNLVEVCRAPSTFDKVETAKRQLQYVLSRKKKEQRKLNAPLAADYAKTLGISIGELNAKLLPAPLASAIVALPPTIPTEPKIPHNLPEAPVRFFGHEQVRQAVSARLADNGLIVLHETGGVGKTTFAKQTAHDAIQSDRLLGGAVWIDCETNPPFEECVWTMAGVLLGSRMENSSVADCEKLLNDYFARRHTLIVFDNFETVLSKDDFNEFLSSHAAQCCILVTTREIHDGMKPHVQTLGELDRDDAIQLFAYEAGLQSLSGEDRSAVWHLCESVGDIPLAILLLARQAPKTTLSQLSDELQRNTELLATDDGFLDARHRSMTACFLTSFERLNSEDRDTLFRLSVVPDGLGKQFAAGYLDKSTWLSSLTICLHSALLKLEGNRYVLHPLLKSFLHNQMGSRKSEWECRFVDFFCQLLNEALENPSEQAAPDFLLNEAKNCEAALWAAADSNRYEHLVLVLELLPEAWHSLNKLPLSEEGFDFQAADEARENVIQFLESALVDARSENNIILQEKLLVLQFEYFFYQYRSVEQRETVLNELAQLNPPRAEALRYVAAARDYIAESECQIAAFELAEEALVKATAIWKKLKERFPGELEASLLNLFTVRSYLKKNKKAAETSRTLWKILSGCSHCITGCVGTSETMPEIEWARDSAKRLEFLTASTERRKERFWRLADKMSETLLRLEQWAEAEPWLKEVLLWKENDPYNIDLPLWEYAMMPLAKVWAKLGRLKEAEGAFYSIARSTRRRDDRYCDQQLHSLNAEAHIEIAKIEVLRGDFDKAIQRALDVAEGLRRHLSFSDYVVPTATEMRKVNRDPEIVKINKLVAEWKRQAKSQRPPKKDK